MLIKNDIFNKLSAVWCEIVCVISKLNKRAERFEFD